MNQINKPVFALKALVLCMGLAGSASSWAETPLGLVISETLTYDSNILKNDADKRSDVVSSTGVKVVFDKQYGRQRYNASAQGILQRYKNIDEYNNDGYQLDLGVTSQIASNGLISVDHTRGQSLQDVSGQGLRRFKETVQTESTSISGRYGLYGRFGLSGSLTNDKVSYDEQDQQDQKINGGRVGLRYAPSDLLSFDFGIKKSTAKYDKYEAFFFRDGALKSSFGESVDRNDINVISQWTVTGYSTLNAQLGWTRERYEKDDARDFSGWTGRAAWNFTPRGKTSYSLAFDRDTNNAGGGTFYYATLPGFGDLASRQAQRRLSTGLQGTATWNATAKISARLALTWRKIEEEQRNLVTGAYSAAAGTYRSATLGLTYVPTDALTFDCGLTTYKRGETILAVGYGGESLSCTASFAIQ